MLFLWIAIGCSHTKSEIKSEDSYSYRREYTVGEALSYKLTAKVNSSTVTGFSEHIVKAEGDDIFEAVEFTHMIQNGNDIDLQNDPKASLSLSLTGREESVTFDGSVDLIGLKADLATFYNALTFEGGAARVQKEGDRFIAKNLVSAQIKNEEVDDGSVPQLLEYKSCTSYSIEMVELTSDQARYKAVYAEPEKPCNMTPMYTWMKGAMNFQHFMKVQNGYNIMWGAEKFELLITVDRKTGRISSGEFAENYLKGNYRLCSDPVNEICSRPADKLEIRRTVTLSEQR